MTMSSAVSKVTLNGDGVQTSWPFAFKVWKAADLEVSITNAAGVTTVVSNWSVSLADTGGTVTYPTSGPALPSGHKITIARSMDFLQDVDLVSGTRWDPEVVETALDRATAERQQLKEKLDRAIVVDIAATTTPEALLESIYAAAERAEIAATTVSYYNHEGTLLLGEDTITLPWAYDTQVGVEVYLNGVKQAESTLTFTDAYTVTLNTPVSADTDFEIVATAGARSDLANILASSAGSNLVGFLQSGTGATARTVQAKLRESVSLADFNATTFHTVRVPTDYPTLQAAFDALAPGVFKSGQYIDVLIEPGHLLTTGLSLKFGDYSHFRISSVDATVQLSPEFVVPPTGNVFDFEQCHAPLFSILVDCGGVGGRAVSYNGSQGFIDSGCGATNAELDGLYMNSGSTVTATGSTWTNCGRHGAWVTRVSLLNAENSTFSDNGTYGITVRRASRANIQGSEVNDNGSSGVVAARSYINFQGRPDEGLDAEAKRNGLHGIVAEHGSTVVATSVDASDNVKDNLVALTGSILEATDCIATGAGRNALTADNGRVDVSRANLSGATGNAISAHGGACAVEATSCDLKNAGSTSVYVVRGARVNVRLSDGSNAAKNGININTGGYVSGESSVFNDCGSSGIFCDNATASVKGAQFRRASVNGVRAIAGSISAQNVDARKTDDTDSTTDFVITSGGIIHAHGGVGGNSTTPNTLTSDGILFRTPDEE